MILLFFISLLKKMKTERVKAAKRVTWVGFFLNLLLSLGKIIAGIFGKSSAMVADGLHSLSDFVTDLIVIIFLGISAKEKDENHKYGHGKFETFATLLISITLLIVSIGILYEGATKVIYSLKGNLIEQPTYIALIAAIISIIIKELLYQYTIHIGRKIESDTVIANGWHHRSDAFSSIGTLIGITGAMFLGEKWRILDPIASVVVSIFIFKVGIDLAKPAIQELLENALPKEIEDRITQTILDTEGIKSMHNLKTRKSGNTYIIDVHIHVDKELSVLLAHDIATEVESRIRQIYGNNTQISTHIEPYYQK